SFAVLPEDIVAIRIFGRGTFDNSMELRRLVELMVARPGQAGTKFIVDLEECATMDSTFMGVLASMGLRQLKETGEKMTVVNANAQNVRLLTTLGLSQFLVIRETNKGAPEMSDSEFQCLLQEDATRAERIIHMIEAHQDLCEVDPSNNLRFESVL